MKTGHKDIDERKLIDRLFPREELGGYEGFWATTYDMQPDFFETDFLPSLLGLGAWDDRHWTTRITMERELAQMRSASIMLDAGRYPGRPRSLRVEILPERGTHNNILHAKVLVTVHEKGVRLTVGSANITASGYRHNIEVSACLSASVKYKRPANLIYSALVDAQEILKPWWTQGIEEVTRNALFQLEQQGDDSEWFVWGGSTKSLAQSFIEKWPREDPPRKVHIISPFWSEEDGNGPISQLLNMLRQRTGANDEIEIHLYTCPNRISDTEYKPTLPVTYNSYDFGQLNIFCVAYAVNPNVLSEELMGREFTGTRPLHAKIVIVEGEKNTLAYLGSANFTHKGWGFLTNPVTANIEAGLVLLRKSGLRQELLSLIPNTIGEPVELSGTSRKQITVLDVGEETMQWPLFLKDARLTPGKKDARKLELVLSIKQEYIKGDWMVCIPDVSNTESVPLFTYQVGNEISDYYRLPLTDEQLSSLLSQQEILVHWWESDKYISFPINVSLEARNELPIAPESSRPGEEMLIAYYQGRITFEELFPPPDGEEINKKTLVLESEFSGVDTSGILSYQIREFVESLDGIRQDLKAASDSERSMRFALLVPVSPVELARHVHESIQKKGRSPTAAGFQLLEILACIDELDSPRGMWNEHKVKAQKEIESMLKELINAYPENLGPRTSFDKYKRAIRS